MNYYNEFDPKAAAWLRELIKQGHIPPGDVDERSITEIFPHELTKYTQCHFFAGIGGWSLALELAGWPSDRPVWTGSCPCQPFSTAGKQLGTADERHLWPVFFNLIRECRPVAVFGEQVANAIGKGWLDGISADLESEGYACGAAVLGAHSVGAPHIRQRLYWVANPGHEPAGRTTASGQAEVGRAFSDATGCGERGGMEHAYSTGSQPRDCTAATDGHGCSAEPDGCDCGLSDPMRQRQSGSRWVVRQGNTEACGNREEHRAIDDGGSYWSDADLIPCADGKARRIKPGLAPLAHGIPARVVRLRGYGNAIVPQTASAFIEAFLTL